MRNKPTFVSHLLDRYQSFIADNRNLILLKNSAYSLLSKGITMMTGFILIPLSLVLVNKSEFGLWLTISSFLGWLSLLDLGVGNGLKNKLTEALSYGHIREGKILVSTAYFIVSIVFSSAIIVFVFVSFLIDWNSFLNAPFIHSDLLRLIIIITFSGFALQMILRLIFSIYMATHQVGKVDLYSSVGQVIIIVMLFLMTRLDINSDQIVALILINTLVPLVIFLLATLYSFAKEFPELKPSLYSVQLNKAKSIFGLGMKFLIIQLAGYLIIGSQQFIIGKIFSQESVVSFSIPHKYYSVLLVGWTIIIAPFWSLLTEAHERQDWVWITKQKRQLLLLYLSIPILGTALFFTGPFVYRLWVGDTYIQEAKLDITIIFFYCTVSFNSTIVIFLNAFSRTKTQLIVSMTVSLAAITCCFFFADFYGNNFYFVPLICSLFLLIAGLVVYFDLIAYLIKRMDNPK